ncbi:hypothetical protein FSP39_021737 [Pinctada imbricata]|uniref:CCHC-type domain-containing protein n=1 Tax=Pinctada imbricata TaxID=66713 RepID=A0AA88XDW8_PINIB|nr:hypothetical protein FSP39_021737 [Pinctada imbricata]
MSKTQNISEGITIVKQRQILVKLADSSELGWKVVQEYQSNPLTKDSDDEKKMIKAQHRAESKAKPERIKRIRIHSYKQGRSQAFPATPALPNSGQYQGQKPGRCFSCGSKGHWKKECP